MADYGETNPPINPNELTNPEQSSVKTALKAEQHAREKFDLLRDHDWYKDAAYRTSGTPVSIKSARPHRRFRIFEDAHDVITSRRGWYVFVVYSPNTVGEGVTDTSIDVKAIARKKAVTVTELIDGWNDSGHERGRQKKLQVEDVFPDEGVDEPPSAASD